MAMKVADDDVEMMLSMCIIYFNVASILIVIMMTTLSNSFAIAGLRSLFGVLSKAVADLKYLEKVSSSKSSSRPSFDPC